MHTDTTQIHTHIHIQTHTINPSIHTTHTDTHTHTENFTRVFAREGNSSMFSRDLKFWETSELAFSQSTADFGLKARLQELKSVMDCQTFCTDRRQLAYLRWLISFLISVLKFSLFWCWTVLTTIHRSNKLINM